MEVIDVIKSNTVFLSSQLISNMKICKKEKKTKLLVLLIYQFTELIVQVRLPIYNVSIRRKTKFSKHSCQSCLSCVLGFFT